MSYEPKPAQSIASNDVEGANSAANNNGNGNFNGGYYQGGGGSVARFITPGGNPIDNSQPAFPGKSSLNHFNAQPILFMVVANVIEFVPISLSSKVCQSFTFGSDGLRSDHIRFEVGIKTPNVILGMALAYGGLVQLLAGMWEFASGNTFAATAFSSYGGFWLSFGAIYVPQLGITAAYGDNKSELASALGIYLASWFIVTFIFFVASWKASIALSALFLFLDITFLLLMCGELTGKSAVHTAGGAFGIITAFIAFYIALAGLLTKDTSYFSLPVGDLSRASTPKSSN
ncbi:hypothetical protein QFC19_006262 [Naganishia cerealis]|uniref:Uncharacterized protein n=1 Tax=Naganishia cerealis TaxID=610337 RepID=A0ACC2VHA3_9TREE|nr:hypothetical protein QFC19_006262 [Naganishia cerealis]